MEDRISKLAPSVALSFPVIFYLLSAILVLGAGCDLFAPRTPEDPITEAGTFTQPDAPDLVVDNLRAAIAELNTANYRRSLAEDLTFEPTAVAQARDPSLWASWSRTEEVSFFTTLAEAARQRSGHSLRLEDAATEIIDGRHPALEQALAEQFVPNDTHLGPGVPLAACLPVPDESDQQSSGVPLAACLPVLTVLIS